MGILKLATGARREAVARIMAAIESAQPRKIGPVQKALLRARLRRATEAQLNEVSAHLLEEYNRDEPGVIVDGKLISTIDWDAFAEFLKTILPVIVEVIKELIPLFSPVVPALVLFAVLSWAQGTSAADVFPSGWRVPAPPGLPAGAYVAFDAATCVATWQTDATTETRWVTRQRCMGGVCRLIRERVSVVVSPRRYRVKVRVSGPPATAVERPPLPLVDKSYWRYQAGGVELFGEALRAHLIAKHGVDAANLAGLDDAALDSLHGHAHEGTLPVAWTRPPRRAPTERNEILLVGLGL